MQSKLYIDMTLIKILLECSVKENKGNKWATKNWRMRKRTLSSPSSHCKVTRHLHCVWEWESELGARSRRYFPLLLILLVVPLLDCLPSLLYSAPAAASSQTDGGYQRLSALFIHNREGVRRGFLHHLSYVHVEKSSPKWCCSRQLEKGFCRPEEFFKWKVLWFFGALQIFKNMHDSEGIMKVFLKKSVFLCIISFVKNECDALHSCACSTEVLADPLRTLLLILQI